jgi:anti-anti-sigma factor
MAALARKRSEGVAALVQLMIVAALQASNGIVCGADRRCRSPVRPERSSSVVPRGATRSAWRSAANYTPVAPETGASQLLFWSAQVSTTLAFPKPAGEIRIGRAFFFSLASVLGSEHTGNQVWIWATFRLGLNRANDRTLPPGMQPQSGSSRNRMADCRTSWRDGVSQTGLVTVDGTFEIEQAKETIIIVPATDLRELDYQRIEDGAKKILELLNSTSIRNVVLDFHKTDYYGSTALSFFLKLWKRVSQRHGRMVLCNVSDHEKEILRITKLDHLWPICASKREALEAVSE